MNKNLLIHQALDAFIENTAIQVRWKADPGTRLDGVLAFIINNQKIDFNIVVKQDLRADQLKDLIELNNTHQHLMVVAPRIFPKVKTELRNNDIAYLEANGNVYLNNGNSYIWIENNKPIKEEKLFGNRAFTKTGVKVVFQFLIYPDLINATYRQIADQTNTGIGNVSNIIKGLKEDGFLIQLDKNQLKLTSKPELITRWIKAYDVKLKPLLKIGTFRFLKEEDFNTWKTLDFDKNKYVWGSEPAGELLTNYLHPAELTIYTTESRSELMKSLRLIPDESGNIFAYTMFWKQDEFFTNVAPPLLAYADLINTNDRRCIETAQKIYDEYLQD